MNSATALRAVCKRFAIGSGVAPVRADGEDAGGFAGVAGGVGLVRELLEGSMK
jgi:hypothetical protein